MMNFKLQNIQSIYKWILQSVSDLKYSFLGAGIHSYNPKKKPATFIATGDTERTLRDGGGPEEKE